MDTVFQDAFSQEVWITTYKDHQDNNIDDSLRRIANAVASVEATDELKKIWGSRFYDLLSQFKMCAGGRIIANAGTGWKGTTLMNCFVGPKPKYDQDSIEGIYHVLLQQAQTLKSEGGWGMNFSFIRPRGSFIYGIGVETPGSVKYMELFNLSSDVITAGSGKKKTNSKGKTKIRKGAMMGVLDVWHPDIMEFITAKLTEGRLNKFNISVNCTNAFMDKVQAIAIAKNTFQPITEEMEKWELIFPETSHPDYKTHWDGNITAWKKAGRPVKVFQTIKVSELWELIMQSTYTRNDPGVLFLDRANETHCWNYGGASSHIAATNPCGEQCLPFGFVCNLASMNLTLFVSKTGEFLFDTFAMFVRWAIRFLDNVNTLTDAPLPEYHDSIKNKRRVGLGVMGWGSMLYMMKIRFGSAKAEELKAKIMETLTHNGVKASIDLAKEKGMFTGCDPIKHSAHVYFKNIGLPQDLLNEIATYGVRNSALFSCQPTGNTGILVNIVSGGIEPVFFPEYTRTVIVDGCPPELLPIVPKYWEGEHKETEVFKWTKEGEDNILRGEYQGIVYKIDKNRGLTKEVACIDYGVRWLKARDEWDASADWAVTASSLSVQDHLVDMKGFAKWIDSSISKTVNLPQDYSYDKFQDLYLDAYTSGVLKGITTYRAGTMMNVLASKSDKKEEQKSSTVITKTVAPKRPNEMQGELHHFVIDGRKYYVAVGLMGEQEPYEVFTGVNETRKEIFIPKKVKNGKIKKHSRHKYTFKGEDGEDYELTNGHSNDTADALSRMISCSLRHGADVSFIVHQLEKTDGPLLSFSKALARTLKRYIKDGTKVTGEECPDCKKQLIRQEGCCVCPSCGFSKCA